VGTEENANKQAWRLAAIACAMLTALGGTFLFILYVGDTRPHRDVLPTCAEYQEVCTDACHTENFGGNCTECCDRATVECSDGRDFELVLKECRQSVTR
jgi:hypothetical protein